MKSLEPIASTDKEILFRDLPWSISSEEAQNQLSVGEKVSAFKIENISIPKPDSVFDLDVFGYVTDAGNVLLFSGIEAGGYDVLDGSLYFSYVLNEKSEVDRTTDQFYLATYTFKSEDEETVFNGLRAKLTELYGEGISKSAEQKGVVTGIDFSGTYTLHVQEMTWYGSSNTFVTLRCVTSDNESNTVKMMCVVSMAYGQSDAEEFLGKLDDALAMERTKKEEESATKENSGL